MTEQEIQIKVAECVGWKQTQGDKDGVRVWFDITGQDLGELYGMPSFTSSIDAIRDEVLKQGPEFMNEFTILLCDMSMDRTMPIPRLDAKDWCDCFLQTWERINDKH